MFAFSLGAAFAAGLTPFLFNFVVDPYGMNNRFDLDLEKFRVSERAHYPLWKMINFPEDGAEVVILGDSRARALREKIWKGLGHDAFNFAYGGATISEIYDTFLHVKSSPKLKTLVVGLPLRSFDPDHRGGMNRVPEAIRLAQDPISYYSSWFVAKMSLRNLQHRYPGFFRKLERLTPEWVGTAKAAEDKQPDDFNLSDLVGRGYCRDCVLPTGKKADPHPGLARQINLGLGRGYGHWGHLWSSVALNRDLPGKFERQVRKNGANDWEGFRFSEELWEKIETIASWSRENNVQLVFVIPPTIVEMQQRMAGFGFTDLNHRFRVKLSELAPVFDFDFDSKFTRDLSRFTDAYHFRGKSAHAIVGEISLLISDNKRIRQRAQRKRSDIICPVSPADTSDTFSDGTATVVEGQSCRIWTWNHG
ncbi:hypothetical protein [Coralliovum pocilloporae]|uniref:hypothetical protein n=1 Tax=Coralliovum pocilloporae TaxID=3066369 RepID=UPI00330737E2